MNSKEIVIAAFKPTFVKTIVVVLFGIAGVLIGYHGNGALIPDSIEKGQHAVFITWLVIYTAMSLISCVVGVVGRC